MSAGKGSKQRVLELHSARAVDERIAALARELAPALEAARQDSPLPVHADVARADRVLRDAREEAARRWIARAPGPWGTDAPAPQEARWDE